MAKRPEEAEDYEYWPDSHNPALRGMYLVGFGSEVPTVYRRATAAEKAADPTIHPEDDYRFWALIGQKRAGRNGRQNCGPRMLEALLAVCEKLNNGTGTEAWAKAELAYIAKAEWELPELHLPYYATRKGGDLYIYRDSPYWFRHRFQSGWLKDGHHDLEDGPLACFRPSLAPVVMSLLFDLNAGTLSEVDARIMMDSHPHLDKDTGLATFTRTTTA